MIIDAYTFCYNEQIRLKYYLNLYAPLCRKITIYDNGSTDKSLEIAKQYNNVVIDTVTYSQSKIDDERLTLVKNNCWKQSQDADLVIVCDVDEILYHEDGLEKYLSRIYTETDFRILQSTGYDMVSNYLPSHDGNFYDDEDFQYGVANRMYDKTCIFSPSSICEINYEPGAHLCNPYVSKPRYRRRIREMSLHDGELKLLHYKYLSEESFVNKQIQFGAKLSQKNIEKEWGFEYLYESEKQEQIFDQKLRNRRKVI